MFSLRVTRSAASLPLDVSLPIRQQVLPGEVVALAGMRPGRQIVGPGVPFQPRPGSLLPAARRAAYRNSASQGQVSGPNRARAGHGRVSVGLPGKTFRIEDPMYLWAAEQIQANPPDFYDVDLKSGERIGETI